MAAAAAMMAARRQSKQMSSADITPMKLSDSSAELPGLEGLDWDPPADRVIGRSEKEYGNKSLGCLHVYTPPRKQFIQLVESRMFDPIILCTIVCNCITMAWESPLDPPGTAKADFIDVRRRARRTHFLPLALAPARRQKCNGRRSQVCEWVYLYIFTFELFSRIIAYGFVMHEGSYLRDPWCQLDFVVVSLAWIPILFPAFGNYSVIRSVRFFFSAAAARACARAARARTSTDCRALCMARSGRRCARCVRCARSSACRGCPSSSTRCSRRCPSSARSPPSVAIS
jgi:hypothetical protein